MLVLVGSVMGILLECRAVVDLADQVRFIVKSTVSVHIVLFNGRQRMDTSATDSPNVRL